MTTRPPSRLTPESKATLRTAVRGLRESLISQLRGSVDQTYLLQLSAAKAAERLSADRRERRRRLEEALAQRAQEDGGTKEARERALLDAVKEAGATLLNRLVLIRHLEAMGLSKPAVVSGGWKSAGYVEFRRFAAAQCEDETQGYGVLLQLLFDELAHALPGLFGDVGLTKLIPVPPETLRALVEALDEVPAEAWRDDMTLGWVYQYWNDPDREALDAKLHERGKLEHHEIASKTQMFTERYMVEWLLHNSLGPTWLAMCRKNGWTPEVEAQGVLAALDSRRADWRKKREAGEVEPDALMPIEGPLEEAWKYYVPQPLTEETIKHAPASIRELKLLDPACGSGHFLVVAFDLLVELYREEARHRGEAWSDRQIAEWILERNLHGVDIDPRAVQIAAAAVWLKAKALAREAAPRQVNLVAPALRLSSLSTDDPALLRLEEDILAETGIPAELTRQITEVLKGVDHLGTLLKVGDAVDKAIDAHRGALSRSSRQSDLFTGAVVVSTPLTSADARRVVLDRLNSFLSSHAGEEDLGLRLRGQQLAAGVRFASIVKEGQYHVVVGNPPYQGTSKLKDAGYVAKHYPRGKSDLYAAFLERGLELCCPGGASAMVTMRSWMFLSGFTALREHLLKTFDLRILGDVDRGAFEEVPDEVVATAMSVFRKTAPASEPSVAMQPTPLSDKTRDSNRTGRKRAAVLAQAGRYEFDPRFLSAVNGRPIVYWWPNSALSIVANTPSLGSRVPAREGLSTANNDRFLRRPWEVSRTDSQALARWVPYVKGAEGRSWMEPLDTLLNWASGGLEVKAQEMGGRPRASVRNDKFYMRRGIAFTTIGNAFSARAYRWPSVFDTKGRSVFPESIGATLCAMNMGNAKAILESLNPGIDFTVGDVNRLPLFEVAGSDEIFRTVESSFDRFESARETSVQFRVPAAADWEYAQKWAQLAVDRPRDTNLPAFDGDLVGPTPHAQLSFCFGVALGRFDGQGAGILVEPPTTALAHGIAFLSPSQSDDAITQVACKPLVLAWESVGSLVGTSLREWLRDEYFELHREQYENRPIYFPVSSVRRNFVAFVSIHRWTDSTLSTLLADHLIPERKALEGSLVDLQAERSNPEKKTRAGAEKRYVQHQKWLEELEEFIAQVRQCVENGPPPSDEKTPAREVDAPYRMDLDDGVMVNSAALWPLLEPMWKDPKKWWKELATAKGRKDYDWSHLAARYFPDRVDEKCQKDPSLAVAHGSFWKYHPEKAYQWELRLQDEIGPDFRIDEADANTPRAAFLKNHATKARELEAAELARRERKAKKQDQDELELNEPESDDEEAEDLPA